MFKIWKGSPSPERRGSKGGSNTKVSGGKDLHPADSVKVDVITDEQPDNPFTEIQVLSHHTDILRFLVKIDKHRFASVGDDAKIVVWDVQAGRNLAVLDFHTRPVTCLCVWDHHGNDLVNGPVLISAASDKQICMWDIDNMKLIRSLSDHNSTARCLIPCPTDTNAFYSAGENLCVWNKDGQLLCKLNRELEEDITALIAIKNEKVVAAVDKRLYVYSKHGGTATQEKKCKLRFVKKLTSHREAIGCVMGINEDMFASGSLDGTIMVWSSQQLVIIKSFNTVRNYEGDDKLYPLSVQHMKSSQNRYVTGAVGSGFRIYDVLKGVLLAEKLNAHYSKVLHVEFVYHGYLLATCSEDGAIRLWGNKETFQNNVDEDAAEPGLSEEESADIFCRFASSRAHLSNVSNDKYKVFVPGLIGECIAHSGAVQACVDIDGDSMVSGGKDGLVILWRNGVLQSLKRNECLKDILYGTANGFV